MGALSIGVVQRAALSILIPLIDSDRFDAEAPNGMECGDSRPMDMLQLNSLRDSHPVDVVETFADENEWSFERSAEDEIVILAQGIWTGYSVSFSWVEAFEALHISCAFDMRIPQKRLAETRRLLGLINEQLLFGHFEIWTEDGSVMFRHGMPLAGGADANDAQIDCMLTAATASCERYYQAFQYVVWGARSATDALDSVLFDTVGEA